jgi:DNA-3-methyladenine glycosylase II
MITSTFYLNPSRPFRLDLTVWTLRRRAANAIDQWDGAAYRRALVLDGKAIGVTVTQCGTGPEPRLRVKVDGPAPAPQARRAIVGALQRLLGLTIDLAPFYRLARYDSLLGPLARRFRGVKPPRFASLFETCVNAIACQQVSLTLGVHLCNRLAERRGMSVIGAQGVQHAFPQPEALTHDSPELFRGLGFSRQKGQAIIDLARAISSGHFDVRTLSSLSDDGAVERLSALRGVGRWTAEYVLLRGLGRLNVFPGDDVGARRNLVQWLHLTEPLDYAAVARVLRRWEPYGGLVYFHLLLDRLARTGHITIPPRTSADVSKLG